MPASVFGTLLHKSHLELYIESTIFETPVNKIE